MITITTIMGLGFNMIQAKKILDAVAIITMVWNGAAFKALMLSAQFTQTSDSSAKIYETITKEKKKIFKINLNAVPNGSEIAATNTVTGVTTIQVTFLNKSKMGELVENVAHEQIHSPSQGAYKHSYLGWGPWKNRYWSAPYYSGRLTAQAAKEQKLL